MAQAMDAEQIVSWLRFWLWSWGLPSTLYVVAQVVALVRLRGAARIWVALPVPFMAWVFYYTFDALAQKANLWPIVLIFTGPVALAYVLAVAAIVFFMARARQKRGKVSA
jgi:hypothetical protein